MSTISCRFPEDILEDPISIDVGEMCTIQLIELINHLFQSTVEHGARVVDPVDAGDTVVAELG